VASRFVSVGELLAPITRMFRVVDDNPLKLRAPVREQFIGELKVGNQVLVGVDAYPRREFPGTISRISPQIDPASRTFQIEVLIPNDGGALRPGGFARARVQSRLDKDVVFVPRKAVVTFAGVNKVFTVKEGKAQEVPVELGPSEGQDVEVLRGPKGGLESVVVAGAERLATGTPVVVTPPAGQQESAGGRDAGPTTRVASDAAAVSPL
jgi:RND family efflux transporter MFP subunit